MVSQIVGALALFSLNLTQETESSVRHVALPGGKVVAIRSFAVGTDREMPALLRSKADLVILRVASLNPATKTAVAKLQKRRSGRRIVFLDFPLFAASPSNGAMWQADWDSDRNGKPDEDAPAWLRSRNAAGWYPVDSKHPEFIKTIIGKEGLMAKIVGAGFDGVMITPPPFDRARAGFDVKLIADATVEARKRREGFSTIIRDPGKFVLFPTVRGFLDGFLLDGIFYGRQRPNVFSGEEHIKEEFEELEFALENRKIVLTLSYTTKPAQIRDNQRRAEKRGILTSVRATRF